MISNILRPLLGKSVARHDLNLFCDLFSKNRLHKSRLLSDAENASRQCLNIILDFTLLENPRLIAETQSQCLQELFAYTLLSGKIMSYLEAGANNGILLSNTYGLMKTSAARGVLVEANPACLPLLEQNRPADFSVNYALSNKRAKLDFDGNSKNNLHGSLLSNRQESASTNLYQVNSITLPDVLSLVERTSLDFMSLDIEGSEEDALKGCSHSFWSCALIEANTRSAAASVTQVLLSLGSHCYRYPFATNEILAISDPGICHPSLINLLDTYFRL